MIISMQGNWTVSVKSKDAAFDQRFIISGASAGNGVHAGVPGTAVAVTGTQWSIAIQNNPGTGFQLSDTQLKFPRRVGNHYEFDILSNDAGGDQDFNDLILTCSTPATINDFIIYGHVTVYSGRCIFNPCRRGPYVIETPVALQEALKNSVLRDALTRLYPERIPGKVIPNPPDPPYFKPIVLDVFNEAMQPRTAQVFRRIEAADPKAKKGAAPAELASSNFELERTVQFSARPSTLASSAVSVEVAQAIEGIVLGCRVESAPNITLSFDEYDRTAAEKAGGAYTGTGPRRILGDTITDMNGNYIFRFQFDLTVPFLEDADDIAPGEDVNVIIFPDVIVKVTGFSPYNVLYESAPYNNIPNLKRIDLCLPKSSLPGPSTCFNGNLIGSLGNVFLGGNQNTGASSAPALLRRYGDGNFLEADGKISVGSALALFSVECAAWAGVIDMKGCMYDAAKPAVQNTLKYYTIRIRRDTTSDWQFVTENYKHPRFSKRNLPNYIGDDVGPFPTSLHVDGGPLVSVPAYKSIQREIFVDGIDWEFSNSDRFIQLNTGLYDALSGVTTPGTFYARVDGYDTGGNLIPNATDMIALFVHNLPLNFGLAGPSFADTSIVYAGCNLYRLTAAQMNTPMQLSFEANDPYGFVDKYELTVGRCPTPLLLHLNFPNPGDMLAGETRLFHGEATTNVHDGCPGYGGTADDFASVGMIAVEIQPAASEGGWIKSTEYFTTLSFTLSAYKRVTNGYNSGLSGEYLASSNINLERLTP